MYLVGITEEDYQMAMGGETVNAKRRTEANAESGVKTVQKHAVYTIRRDPTVKAIADSLFRRKKIVTPA